MSDARMGRPRPRCAEPAGRPMSDARFGGLRSLGAERAGRR